MIRSRNFSYTAAFFMVLGFIAFTSPLHAEEAKESDLKVEEKTETKENAQTESAKGDEVSKTEMKKTEDQEVEKIDLSQNENLPYTYSPEYCDFIAGFPEEPYVTHHCENEDDKNTCFNLASYTKVFGLSSTVKFEVICNPATPEMYDHFKPEIMESTVQAMTKDSIIEAFHVNSREEENYRQSGIVAQGRQGLHNTLYIAQLWVTKGSIMSVEAELMGEQSAESDQLFAEILRNIGYSKNIKKAENDNTNMSQPDTDNMKMDK